ncbi:MAG: S-methyl-5-thioribose-1-phosphate isomerase [Nitrososphaerota archaeon]|jgi:methylthioribose-1-phosphate isomerase|nr:S-methyl-5-thioribose-1-phosphate isomerase [Nitrososphaerota archaeon]MDG6978869.1 S-methyl-5-thioribose-1-phosphate isomerase [Nitrososphaerota archaeon]MDG7020417.1 S-methyl-5-thioribose-1-phosphate isomerase [Nitrososphaerota archaeon]MDG7021792.1 S-methyl-5-thioribose-1-phosphate isomerase [Nitrososphaerota archaeon]
MWDRGKVKMIDQTLLPARLVYRSYARWEDVADAIRRLVVRGAPAIGVAAAMAIAATAWGSKAKTADALRKELEGAAAGLRSTRPTAVNLFWGIDRVMAASRLPTSAEDVKEAVVKEATQMAEDDVEACKRIGRFGADLIDDGDTVITQCNAGALATVGYGTALGVLRAASEQGKCVKVIVPETRPALQGSRLTAFELSVDGFGCTVISDTAVGHMMASGRVDKAVVGADRVTRDGFVFNKIGTYQVAVLAKRHGVPFYPAAPTSSFDLTRTHQEVVIEERPAREVFEVRGRRVAPRGVPVANPAFDVTPPDLVEAIVTDRGLVKSPVQDNIGSVVG